ncbi:MAG TPA: hypothetical protein VM537_06120 [Anaerolineae bacterium]|nr:hypothetical protein [Anaerolineae bacterium]
MLHKRIASLMLVVVLLGLVAGCAAPAGSGEALESFQPDLDAFMFRLPRIYVQYLEDSEGGPAEPAVWGMRASLLESMFGLDLSMVKIPQFYVDWIKDSDLQHVELVHDGQGIFIYANGKPTPYVAWDGESMDLLSQMLGQINIPNGSMIRSLLPLIRHIGLDIVVQMPLAAGTDIIPYRDPEAGYMESMAAIESADPAVVLKLQASYDEGGVPSLLGMSAGLLEPMMGYTPGALDPELIAQLKGAGIEALTLRTQGNGLFIYVNDLPLPNIAWSKEHLANALDLYEQMNRTSWVPNADFVNMVRELVFQVSSSDVQLTIALP